MCSVRMQTTFDPVSVGSCVLSAGSSRPKRLSSGPTAEVLAPALLFWLSERGGTPDHNLGPTRECTHMGYIQEFTTHVDVSRGVRRLPVRVTTLASETTQVYDAGRRPCMT